MGGKFVGSVMICVVVTVSIIGGTMAAGVPGKPWSFGFNNSHNWWSRFGNKTQQEAKTIIVGGSQHWQFGFNYSDWAIKNAPFYLNDTLVFKYEAPNATNLFQHSVYLFPNLWSFMKCDIKKAKRVAKATQGGGEGFKFLLNKWQPYYFACGEKNGFHCNNGLMKFAVFPMIRPFWSSP
ncbi:uncharacterized protein LOC130957907 [Arachis stenosperma]|uniref:uncharacterized protein LOC130957907 n=1 Tax=Arachis stenosperma TaxID=217475 RepID=UPI0025AC3F46|nr:uncharacterized protein LOC130957907 [Arachis stenosperma]